MISKNVLIEVTFARPQSDMALEMHSRRASEVLVAGPQSGTDGR